MTKRRTQTRSKGTASQSVPRGWGDDTVIPHSGLSVPKELKDLLARPGYLPTVNNGPGQRARRLYAQQSIGFHPYHSLSTFGFCTFVGLLDEVEKIMKGDGDDPVPSMDLAETAYEVGYVTIAIWGSQRSDGIEGRPPNFPGILKFLIDRGAPVDQADIMGYTPVHHYLMNPAHHRRNTKLLEMLLKAGANPNAQDKVGAVPILAAFEHGYVEAIELLMDHGADLSIKDADGNSPMSCYTIYGPTVTAAVEKGLRKRSGERMAREEKSCEKCRASSKQLSACAACQVTFYCSKECQKTHWKEHKPMCRIFKQSDTVTVKPFYEEGTKYVAVAELARTTMGTPGYVTQRQPTEPIDKGQDPRHVVVKVQVPQDSAHPIYGQQMLVFIKKKTDLQCTVRREDDAQVYDRLHSVVKEKGVQGRKAYFSATIHSKDKLEIKVSEVLAPQPF